MRDGFESKYIRGEFLGEGAMGTVHKCYKRD